MPSWSEIWPAGWPPPWAAASMAKACSGSTAFMFARAPSRVVATWPPYKSTAKAA